MVVFAEHLEAILIQFLARAEHAPSADKNIDEFVVSPLALEAVRQLPGDRRSVVDPPYPLRARWDDEAAFSVACAGPCA